MADESSTDAAPMPRDTQPPSPVGVDGAGTPIGTPTLGQTPDGKQTRSDVLYDNGLPGDDRIYITRERVADGDHFDDVMTIHTSDKDDDIRLSQRPDGVLEATVNGQPYELTLGPDQELGVRSNGDNDRIIAADTSPVFADGVDPSCSSCRESLSRSGIGIPLAQLKPWRVDAARR